MRVALIQMRSGVDRAANVGAAEKAVRKAAKGGATFIFTPEMTNVLDRDPKRLLADLPREEGLSEIARFAALAGELGVHLFIGSMALKLYQGAAANRAYVFGPQGRVLASYDKLHMFDVDLPTGESWRESRLYKPGGRAVLVETPDAKIGLSVCYDIRFPHLYRALAKAGAEILTVPAAFTAPTGEAHWETLLRARAIETGAYVVAAAQGGEHEDGRRTWGRSTVVDPWGAVAATLDHDRPGVLYADLDLEKVAEARRRIPSLANDRDFAVETRR
ncbi:MAG: carbon-nitrogen hydrolase family protein [Pseudomonadota bacterium]